MTQTVNFFTATTYLKQCIESLVDEKVDLDVRIKSFDEKQQKLIKDREVLIAEKSAFRKQTGEMTVRIEKAEKMHNLAIKIKAQTDEDRADIDKKAKLLADRELKVKDLEKKAKELDDLAEKLKLIEEELKERELLLKRDQDIVEKDKIANRNKEEDLIVAKKALEKKQERLQKMIEAQNV